MGSTFGEVFFGMKTQVADNLARKKFVLLFSADFLVSNFIREKELPVVMRRYKHKSEKGISQKSHQKH